MREAAARAGIPCWTMLADFRIEGMPAGGKARNRVHSPYYIRYFPGSNIGERVIDLIRVVRTPGCNDTVRANRFGLFGEDLRHRVSGPGYI